MLYVDLWGARRKGDSAKAAIGRLRRHPAIVGELLALLEVLDDRAHVLTRQIQDAREFPLTLHARYSQDEALAAVGASTPEAPRHIREGVFRDRQSGTDLFFVTLQKSDREFSPSTRYRDFAISPTLFHWESQSTTSVNSITGRRYQSATAQPLLFVRRTKRTDAGLAAAFTYLGPATYVRHEGSLPMAITWQLRHAMLAELYEEAAVAAV